MISYAYIFIYLIGFFILLFVTYKGFKSINNERKVPYLLAALFGFLSFFFSLIMIVLKITNMPHNGVFYFLDTLSVMCNVFMAYFWFVYIDYLQGKNVIKKIVIKVLYTIPLILIEAFTLTVYLVTINTDFISSIYYEYYNLLQIFLIFFYVGIASLRLFIITFRLNDFRGRHEHLTISLFGLYPLLFGIVQIMLGKYDLISTGIVLAMLQAYLYVNSLEKQRDSFYERLLSFSKLFLVTYFVDLVNSKTEILSENTYYSYQKFSELGYEKRIKDYTDSANDYVANYVHPDDKAMMYKVTSKKYIIETLSEGNQYFSCVYRQIFNGVTKWYRMYVVLQSFEGDNRNVVVAIMNVDDDINKDIKQRKLIEDALEEAQRANSAKSHFLSNVSHDIRTPMNAILGYTEIANMYIDNKEKVKDCLNKISSSGNHLLELINNVLDMNKIESGKISLELKECSLNDITQSVLKIIQNQVTNKNLEFKFEINVNNDEVIADKLKITQILINLLSNSIKYSLKDGIVVFTINEITSNEEESNYEFIVADNGIGIDEVFLDKLFKPFEREKSTTESGIEGTGLGLSIVKSLVDLMGGSIDVKSVSGKGTKFTLNLSFKHASKEESSNATLDEYSLNNKRILVVDDNDLNYEIVYELLSALGAVVERSINGLDAYKKVEISSIGYYDLILMDVQMPIMNGYDSAKKIRMIDNKALANIPIIAMTANAFDEDINEALASGMNGHVSKPIEFEKLLFEICKILK